MDRRLTGMCVYCGAEPDTRDHVPSKVFLDAPYPPELPVVAACKRCNESFSLDEQYLACFLDCVVCGGTEGSHLLRTNVKRIFDGNPALKQRIESAKRMIAPGDSRWEAEPDRVRNVVLKLAKGHTAYELYPKLEDPDEVSIVPMQMLNEEKRLAFEQPTANRLKFWPEIGSRSFLRAFGKFPDRLEQSGEWIMVQPDRYRYAVAETNGVLVRMVLSEYLCCMVHWEE